MTGTIVINPGQIQGEGLGLTPGIAGVSHLTSNQIGGIPVLTVSGTPLIFTSTEPIPTKATLSGPTTGPVGQKQNFTITLDVPIPSDGQALIFSFSDDNPNDELGTP